MKYLLFISMVFSGLILAQKPSKIKTIEELNQTLQKIEVFAQNNQDLTLAGISDIYSGSSLNVTSELYDLVNKERPDLIRSGSLSPLRGYSDKIKSGSISVTSYLNYQLVEKLRAGDKRWAVEGYLNGLGDYYNGLSLSRSIPITDKLIERLKKAAQDKVKLSNVVKSKLTGAAIGGVSLFVVSTFAGGFGNLFSGVSAESSANFFQFVRYTTLAGGIGGAILYAGRKGLAEIATKMGLLNSLDNKETNFKQSLEILRKEGFLVEVNEPGQGMNVDVYPENRMYAKKNPISFEISPQNEKSEVLINLKTFFDGHSYAHINEFINDNKDVISKTFGQLDSIDCNSQFEK